MVEGYLRELARSLGGRGRSRRRFLTELRQHLDDAIAEELDGGATAAAAEARAVERLGPHPALAEAWRARCSRVRARRRGRVALLAAAVAAAGVLGVTQHADGRRDPGPPRCAAAAAGSPCTSELPSPPAHA